MQVSNHQAARAHTPTARALALGALGVLAVVTGGTAWLSVALGAAWATVPVAIALPGAVALITAGYIVGRGASRPPASSPRPSTPNPPPRRPIAAEVIHVGPPVSQAPNPAPAREIGPGTVPGQRTADLPRRPA